MASCRRQETQSAAWRSTRARSDGFAKGETSTLAEKLGELRFYRRFLDEVSAIEDELAA